MSYTYTQGRLLLFNSYKKLEIRRCNVVVVTEGKCLLRKKGLELYAQ